MFLRDLTSGKKKGIQKYFLKIGGVEMDMFTLKVGGTKTIDLTTSG